MRQDVGARRVLWLVVVVVLTAGAACGRGSSSAGDQANVGGDPNDEGAKVAFDPANFVDPTLDTNPYHPLEPGTQWVYGGTTEVGSREVGKFHRSLHGTGHDGRP